MQKQIVTIFFLGIISCSESMDDGFESPESFIQASELEKSNYSNLDAPSISSKMDTALDCDLYNTEPNECTEADSEPDCTIPSPVLQSKGDTLSFSGEIDVTECSQGSEAVTVQKAIIDIRIWARCSTEKVKKIGGLVKSESADCNKYEEYFYQAKTIVTSQFVNTGATWFLESISGTTTSDFKPCVIANNISNDCMEYVATLKSDTLLDGVTTENVWRDLQIIDLNDAICAEGNLWCHTGTIGVTINNWSGNISLISATDAPVYTMSDGTNTISGGVPNTPVRPQTLATITGMQKRLNKLAKRTLSKLKFYNKIN